MRLASASKTPLSKRGTNGISRVLNHRVRFRNAGFWVCAALLVVAVGAGATVQSSSSASAQTERAADGLPLYDDRLGRPRSRLVDIAPLSPPTPAPSVAETPVAPEPVVAQAPAEPETEVVDVAPEPVVESEPSPEPEPTVTAAVEPPQIFAPIAPDLISVLFPAGGAELPSDAQSQLDAVVAGLNADSALRLQLKAYADGSDGAASAARRLSLSRALAVRGYLIDAGVSSTRIDVRALGSKFESGPADRVDVISVK